MHGQLTTLEPLALLDPRKPTRMPSLPAWVTSRANVLVENLQIHPASSTFRDVLTLPAAMMLTDQQRRMIEEHIRGLRSLLLQTPDESPDAEAATLVIITKLLLAKPSQGTSEKGAEAKGEAYMIALDDVPAWAVDAAVRRWYRGDCGKDDRGKPYDYTWAPDSAVLRKLAIIEAWRVKGRIGELQKLLDAVEFVDCSEALERGQAAMRGFWQTWRTQGGDLAALTFEQAVNIGKNLPPDTNAVAAE